MPTPTEHREERIKYLKRQEDRKRRLPDLLGFLSSIAERAVTEDDVLSIEETDRVWERIRESDELSQASLSVTFPFAEKAKLKAVLSALQTDFSEYKHYFTTSRFSDACFLHIDTSFCIEIFEQVIEYDGDTFYIYDHSLHNGLWVDSNEENWRGKERLWTYELRVRGTGWIEKAFNAYKTVMNRGSV